MSVTEGRESRDRENLRRCVYGFATHLSENHPNETGWLSWLEKLRQAIETDNDLEEHWLCLGYLMKEYNFKQPYKVEMAASITMQNFRTRKPSETNNPSS